jgi:hypothetical protein
LTSANTLKSLEKLLVSFLDQAVALKEDRLLMLEGINRLDDIARDRSLEHSLTDETGNWFAVHHNWLEGNRLKPADRSRIGAILGKIHEDISISQDESPAAAKISKEIERWLGSNKSGDRKIVLTRGPEVAPADLDGDTIALFGRKWERLTLLLADLSGDKGHLLSVLDDALKKATMQNNEEALLLSAFMIYYLKQNGYKVEPYVRRLKEAESLRKGSLQSA